MVAGGLWAGHLEDRDRVISAEPAARALSGAAVPGADAVGDRFMAVVVVTVAEDALSFTQTNSWRKPQPAASIACMKVAERGGEVICYVY